MQQIPTHKAFPDYRARGNYLLQMLLCGGLLLLALTIWMAPESVIYVPAILIAVPIAFYLFAHPLANIAVVLFGFVALTDYTPGLQITEVAYGLYSLTYLAHWFFVRIFLYEAPFLKTAVDKAMFGLLILVTCYIPIAILFGGSGYGIFAEWSAFVLLAFYFPIKDTIASHRHGATIVLAAIGFIGAFVASRNFINYREMLLNATQIWQVARGRISTNDNLLMISSMYGLVLLVFANRSAHKMIALGAFVLFFSGLILTQSRGYWVAFLLGATFMFIIADRRIKRRIIIWGTGGGVALALFAMIFLQEYIALIFSGLLERLVSLRTASSADISLVNRFRETATVWDHIVKNPIMGYGMGVSYDFFDITNGVTETDAFIHNGYISLWYKYGLLGLVLVLFIWLSSIWLGVKAYRFPAASAQVRLAGLIAASALTAFLLSCNTSNPFFLNDTLFAFALLLGTAAGAHERASREAV